MNFPQFWAKGCEGKFVCWRWSSQSLAEAQSLALEAARELARRFQSGKLPPSHGAYYPDRPFREQILQEIKNEAGEVSALVTRNTYGCQVLNTARVMFVDIDLDKSGGAIGLLARLFGKPTYAPPQKEENAALGRIENWTRGRPAWGWRVYRTRAGLRLLATHGLVEADSADALCIFDALGADPLYRKLCQSQKCYRARLTPKPWRCGIRARPVRWPWANPREAQLFEKWETHYNSMAFNWSTCAFVRQFGNKDIHPEAAVIIKLHDSATRVESKLRLA